MALTPESQVIYIGNPKRNPFVISPNLEALLEHDQRTRPRRLVPEPPPHPSTTGAFIGLPPPPRGPRKTSPAKTDAIAAIDDQRPDQSIDPSGPQNTICRVKSSPSSHALLPVVPASGHNPFINPAPSLESVLEAKAAMLIPLVIEPVPSLPRDHRTYAAGLSNDRWVDPPSGLTISSPSPSPSGSSSMGGVRRRTRRRIQASLPYQPNIQASSRTYVNRVWKDPLADPSNRSTTSNAQSSGSGNGPSEKASTDVRDGTDRLQSQLGTRLQIQRLV